ncbi:MAG: MBL fold metallo-hydrolase [Planctomycetes bacterium]|nr:MBL fold metallo-hydrolase [Planctomycetota bacterium]
MTAPDPFEWTVAALKNHLDAGEDLFVLDVRNREEFAAGRVEGRTAPPTLNIPYFEILEAGGADDLVEAVKIYAGRDLADKLPRGKPIVTVCARGGTSAIVAEGLRAAGFPAVNVAGGTQAWGSLYTSLALVNSPALKVWQVARPARGCLSYLVACHGDALVIDPLRHTDWYVSFARRYGLLIRSVLDTHAHADHLSGGPALAKAVGATYHLHPYDAIHPIDVLPATISYEPLRDRQIFNVGTSRLEVLHIPGHTLGNTAFLLDGKYLFSGDSLFVGSIARPDLGGHAEAWTPLHHDSLRRLMALPDDTLVLPGHAASPGEAGADGVFGGRLGGLKRSNEGLRKAAGSGKEFLAYILASLPEFPPQYVEIKRANLGLIEPDEDRAGELELGKNVCALESRCAK